MLSAPEDEQIASSRQEEVEKTEIRSLLAMTAGAC